MKTKQIAQWRLVSFLALVLLGVAGCGNPILRDAWITALPSNPPSNPPSVGGPADKAAGGAVGTPGGNSAGTTITVTPVTVDNDEQEPEYAISTGDTAPADGWQTSLSFADLSAGVTYYVYARAGESANYLAGAAVRSAAITVGKLSQAAFVFAEETVSKTYGDVSATYTATGGSVDGGISYVASGAVSVDAASGVVAILKAGTGYITATKAGDATYNAVTATLTVTVAKRPLTAATVTAKDRVYDGTETVTVTITADNTVGDDEVSITATGTMADANADTDKTVIISNIALAGTAADNYTAPESIADTTVNISKRPLTAATATATDRDYDGTETVTVTITAGNKVDSDEVSIKATGTMEDADVGTDKTVIISNIALAGTAADNYTAPASITGVKVTISKAAITPVLTVESFTAPGEPVPQLARDSNPGSGSVSYIYSDGLGGYSDTAPTKAGTYKVKATVEETANYLGGLATVSFTIFPAGKLVTAWVKDLAIDTDAPGNKVTLSRIGADNALTVTVKGDDYGTSYQWYIGVVLEGTEKSFTFDSNDWDIGNYWLTLWVTKDDVPYTTTIAITVED